MFNIPSLLEKFSQLKDPKDTKSLISKILFEEIGVDIPISEIQISKDSIILQSGSVLKNQVFLKKNILLIRINKELPELGINNIY